LLRNINHQWFNRLSKDKQAIINRMFQEYKRQHYQKCTIDFVDSFPFRVEVKTIEFKPEERKRKYNREEAKRDFRQRLEEDSDEYMDR
jgi:TRAP-type C4-dicarboxylate transport system substrate-binding protein